MRKPLISLALFLGVFHTASTIQAQEIPAAAALVTVDVAEAFAEAPVELVPRTLVAGVLVPLSFVEASAGPCPYFDDPDHEGPMSVLIDDWPACCFGWCRNCQYMNSHIHVYCETHQAAPTVDLSLAR